MHRTQVLRASLHLFLNLLLLLNLLLNIQPVSSTGLKGPPKIHSVQSRLITGEEGDAIKLPCPITATPEPLFEWTKDGVPVDETWPRYVPRRHFLRIKSAREDDTGEFTCTGVNGFGKVAFTFSVLIYGENMRPTDAQTPTKLLEVSPSSVPVSARVGEVVAFLCKADGVPVPKVTWSKDGIPLHKSGTKLHRAIHSISDAGLYSCTAANPLAILTHNFTVTVIQENWSDDPEILQSTNRTVFEGGNITLTCLFNSPYPTEIQWVKLLSPAEVSTLPRSHLNRTIQRGGRTFQYMSSPGLKMERENSTYLSKLLISHASPAHQGLYYCVSANTHGYTYQELRLRVLPSVRRISRHPDDVIGGVTAGDGVVTDDSNLTVIILPIVGVVIVTAAVIFVCRSRRSPPEKPPPSGAQNTTLESTEEDPTSNTPLNMYKQPKAAANLPPDIVYQDGSSYTTHMSNVGPINGSVRYADQYLYPDTSYLEPNYSDPYLDPVHDPINLHGPENNKVLETRGSDQSYARLTQSTQSSTSPLPPPPYTYQLPFNPPTPLPPHSHSLSHHSIHHPTSSNSPFSYTTPPHPHRETKYVVHYNL